MEYKKGTGEFPGQPTPFMRGNALSSVGSKVKTIIHAEQESTSQRGWLEPGLYTGGRLLVDPVVDYPLARAY